MSDSPRSVRLILQYEGTAYCGWQVQPNGLSVQQVLEEAIEKMINHRVRAKAAGRTDAGVHAAAQVVCFENPSRRDPETLRKGLNFHLPEDIGVVEASWAEPDFNPRMDAVGKHYRYTIHNHPSRPVLRRCFRWHLTRELDLAAMRTAARTLLGEHDFSALRGSGCSAKSPVRTIDRIGWRRDGDALILDVFGRAFLKHMVRNIAGTCVEIGRGRWPAEKMTEILESRDRTQAGPTAPAAGLCLERVFFEEDAYRAAWGQG